MRRERALKVVLVVVGLIFCGLIYPLTMFVRQEPALAMMLSVYVTLGIFLLMAARALRKQGIMPPGVEDAEVYRGARAGYFVSPDESPWRELYANQLAASARPTQSPLRAAE